MNPESQFSRLSSIALMIAILGVASILSALTAMRIAIRGREVDVPSLAGKSEIEALQILAQKGLQFRVSGTRFSSDVPEHRIIDQVPTSGTRLKVNRTVKVLVSLGERKYAVPNLVGASQRAAQLTLAERKLTLGITDYAHTEEGDVATVVLQSPPPETLEGADPSVNILISLGPLEQSYTMPDLVGQSSEAMVSRARAEGFRIGKMNYRKYSGAAPGVVIQQKPQAGYRLAKTDTITLDVSQ